MADAAVKTKPATTTAEDTERELTDGFHLVIDALKLNGINTIYGVPGIPITDLGRMMQGAGIRVISFRHEQNAGNAAAIAGFLTKKPGICLTVSAPGFLNGLTALANATTNCFPMILIAKSSICSRATTKKWTNSPLPNRSARRPSVCCMPQTSALAWPARSARLSRGVPAASISICRPSCSLRSWTRMPERSRS
jgi:hypothetical protein